ncbi:MAG: hypothetical protein [Bacteriophage sp.]|nr:MAG: hypothetical protein [Bacteriophage sp.]
MIELRLYSDALCRQRNQPIPARMAAHTFQGAFSLSQLLCRRLFHKAKEIHALHGFRHLHQFRVSCSFHLLHSLEFCLYLLMGIAPVLAEVGLQLAPVARR